MLFTNSTQFAVLALMLFVGFLFGLAARSGGQWKRAYRDREALVRDRDARITQLERDNAALSAEVERARVPVAAPAAVPAAAAAAWPASDATSRRRWFDWDDRRRVS